MLSHEQMKIILDAAWEAHLNGSLVCWVCV